MRLICRVCSMTKIAVIETLNFRKNNIFSVALRHIAWLTEIRKSVLMRCTKMVHDRRPSIQHVLRNNQKILRLLDNAISYARDSTQTIGGEDK